ncbi:uncharacterized protein LOC141641510 [Silene latifolia]|uniref:uncharacterized protein LOC141641510 n=1 Tax=Silene latifolia TaxID=37657 RepID=UPI003D785C0D
MVGRLVDWVATNKESLWVKWVNANYLKGREWQEYAPTSNSSWGIWQVQPSGYTPAGCYEWLRGTQPTVEWSKAIWDNWSLPKHRFLGWLIAHNSLHTNSRLMRFGMDVDGQCVLCGLAEETQQHLFFSCAYTRRVLKAVMDCTSLKLPEGDILHWCVHNPGLKIQRGVKVALVMSILYQVWQQRNKCRVEQVLMRPMCLAQRISEDMRKRIRERDKCRMTTHELDWLGSLKFT